MNKRQYKKHEKKMHEQGKLTLRELQIEKQQTAEFRKEIFNFIMTSDTEIGKILRATSELFSFM